MKNKNPSERLENLARALAKNPMKEVSQEQFADLCGIDHSVVSRLRKRDILSETGGWIIWLKEYQAYQKGVSAGRRGSGY